MPKKTTVAMPPTECPVCGAEVPPKARTCPECGADERSGWNEDASRYDGLDLPEEAFEETASRKKVPPVRTFAPAGVPVFWWVVGLGITLLVTYLVARGRL